ncbi:unnamed protein product, partial [Iphiclides podalirius]
MKELLVVVSLLWGGALAEAPAPYAPSGWRPSGPAFELPTKEPTELPQRPEYLPPVDPRNNRPLSPDVDVSVQGLPAQEQLPVFLVSPVNGQQYVGPKFNSDIKGLERNFHQSQFQLQQEKARQFSRQQQFPVGANAASGLPNPQPPKQFVPQTAVTTTSPRPKEAEPTTEPSTREEKLDDEDSAPQRGKTSVEVSKQNLQEYPPELFLSSLAQLQLQPQFVPLQQFGQIREQVFYQSTPGQAPEKQVESGYDGPAHFAALPSVLAQNQLARQQQPLIPVQQAFIQNPALVPQGQEQPASPIIVSTPSQEPLPQYQPVVNQYQPQLNQAPQPQYQPAFNQYQPTVQGQVLQGPLPQYQPAVGQYQPAVNQYQPAVQGQVEQIAPDQYQPAVSQYQPAVSQYQPAVSQYQPAVSQYQPAVQGQVEQIAPTQYQPPVSQYQPTVQGQVEQIVPPQYQPAVSQYQPIAQPQPYPQFQAQPVIYQPQPSQAHAQNAQASPQTEDTENDEQQPQYVYQQPQYYQPQEVYQPQYQPQIPASQFYAQPQGQGQIYPQDLNRYQGQADQLDAQAIVQGQDAIQSGLDINQEGNGLDQPEDPEDSSEQDVPKATAVATAFGARTQPRSFSQYGAPAPSPRDQAGRGYRTTTESTAEETTEDAPAVAQATAVATPSRSRSAKLRSRRPSPLFTVDRSGHLVLAREQ